MDVRHHLPCSLMSLGAAVTIWGSFQPWLASGTAERTSYQLLGVVDRIGSPTGLLGWGVAAWPVMPLLVVTATVAMWCGRRLAAIAVGAAGGLYAAGVSLGVTVAPGDGLIRSLPGAPITLAGSALFLIGLLAGVTRRATRPVLRAPLEARPAHRS